MKKILSLFFVALFSVSMFGNSYWYAGAKQGSTWGADAMTVSADGFYEYIDGTYNGKHSFKIRLNNTDWTGALGNSYTASGYNGTNVTDMNSASSQWDQGENGNIQIQFNSNDTYYIIVYYPNTRVNPTENPKICASTTLPNNSTKKFYIIGDAAIMGAWDEANAVLSTADSYTFNNLAAGVYQLDVLPTGRWADNVTRRYDQLTDQSDPGLTSAGNDHNICFRLTSTANVTITYTGAVFTVTTDDEFFHLANGYYLHKYGQEVYELYSTPFNEHKSNEWKLTTSLTEGDQIKVVTVESNAIVYYWPNAGDHYSVDANHAGAVNIYFKRTYQNDWAAFGGYFYIEQDKGTAIDEAVAGKKAVKRIVNGQLVIEREGKMYNALGAEVK